MYSPEECSINPKVLDLLLISLIHNSELRVGWLEGILRRRQCHPFQNWRVPEESGHPSKKERTQVTSVFNFSLLNFPINAFAIAWNTSVSQCVYAVLTTLNNSLLLSSGSVCAQRLWFTLCVCEGMCVCSQMSVLSWVVSTGCWAGGVALCGSPEMFALSYRCVTCF